MSINYRPLPGVSTPDAKRFWASVDKRDPNECWPWTASVNTARDGYGRFWIKRVEYRTNRMAFYLHYGIDPGEQDACHTCDNPPCCNPVHLFTGTRKENLDDAKRKGRTAKGANRGAAKLNDEQVREIKRLYVPRKVGCYKLADKFGVT
jgi:hypothetical protein